MKIKLIIILAAVFLICGIAFATETPWSGLDPNLGGDGSSIDGVLVVAPTASKATDTYHSSQSVTLTSAGSNSIRYTTDGSVPTCPSTGTLYAGAFTVNASMTLKARACYKSDNSFSSAVSSYAYTFTCPTVDNAATYNAYPTCGPATCNTGYDKSGNTCVVHHSSSSSSGGGGSVTTYCTAVTFGDWQSNCFNGIQYRNTLTQTPTGCSLTSAQQLEQQRACSTTTTPPITLPVTPTPPSGNTVLQNIALEAKIMDSNNRGALLAHLGVTVNGAAEQAGLVKYKTILGLDKNISAADKTMLNYFIVYGTNSTHRLGAGERAAVLNSYFQAYKRLPNSEAEWSDVLKIASGRWPSERSATAEAVAKVEFKKVYVRSAVMTNNIDENAIMVIAYGLLPLQRNLNSETVAIKTFRWVYGHDPINALAWNIVRAIAYSGATR